MYITREKVPNNNAKLLLIIIISLFAFSQEFRSSFGNTIYTYNILALISIIILFIKNIKKINRSKFITLYLTIIIYLVTTIFYVHSLSSVMSVILLFILPLGLTIVEIDNDNFIYIFKSSIIALNIIICVITIIGVLETVFNININVMLSKFMSSGTQQQIIANSMHITGKRMYSFMGHPLFNTELYLMFLVLNILYNKYVKEQSCSVMILIIAAIGIALTGSKTGFVLLSITSLILFKNDSKSKKILIIALGVFVAIKIGLFDIVIDRFAEGSLTSGRSEKWNEIQSMNIYPLRFFWGYGRGFTFVLEQYVEWASAAYEYPILMFSLEFGMLLTIMIYIFIILFPVTILIKRKHWTILFSFLIVFLDVNTYNGLSGSGDKMMIFCLFIFLILNLSNLIKKFQNEIQQSECFNTTRLIDRG